jgi:type VI secretion system protein ImpF
MARVRPEQPLLPSVLDRLLDDEPETTREAPRNRGQLLRDLKASVCRDLEHLLNTRARALIVPSDLKELKQSLVNYGLSDFTSMPTGSARDREALARAILAVIRQHEPRFKKVDVKLLDNAEALDRTLRFRIEAMLHAEPAPEPVVFDSMLKPATGDFEVRGASG